MRQKYKFIPAVNLREDGKSLLLCGVIFCGISLIIFPISPAVLDFGLTLSFSLSALMLVVACFIKSPLEFQYFPETLLISIVLRFCLNIASTKLIITNGHSGTQSAGQLIEIFADIIIADNLLIGITIFILLSIVNFMVITKGAGRMAEVGARFALDGMPGKQMSIDADLASGSISHIEARQKRKLDLTETSFYGSLDGTAKFVRGDAISGILITFTNIIFGVTNGTLNHSLTLKNAAETYTILTIGDALAGQLPALLSSIAIALLLSKSGHSHDGAKKEEINDALTVAQRTVAAILFLLALLPGTPTIIFLLMCFSLVYLSIVKPRKLAEDISEQDNIIKNEGQAHRSHNLLDIIEIKLEISNEISISLSDHIDQLEGKITRIRDHIAQSYGLLIPEITISNSDALAPTRYRILIFDSLVAQGTLEPDKVMILLDPEEAISEECTFLEPIHQAKAKWIDTQLIEEVASNGKFMVSPVDLLCSHLLSVISENLHNLLTLKTTNQLIEYHSGGNHGDSIRKMLQDRVPVDLLHAILKLLLSEKISIKNLPYIIETLAEAPNPSDFTNTYESVRSKLAVRMLSNLLDHNGNIHIAQLSSDWEPYFSNQESLTPNGTHVISDPKLVNLLIEKLKKIELSEDAIFICAPQRRIFLKDVITNNKIRLKLFTRNDIPPGANIVCTNIIEPR